LEVVNDKRKRGGTIKDIYIHESGKRSELNVWLSRIEEESVQREALDAGSG